MTRNLVLSKAGLFGLLGRLSSDYDVFVPIKKGQQRFYKKYSGPSSDIMIGEVRPFEPLKAFFSRARELIAERFEPGLPDTGHRPAAIVGVKACDLKGFKIQDHVFRDNGYKDPAYIRNREAHLIIGTDCTCAIDTCFCLAMGIKPHPQEGFDLNLSEVADGFAVEVGSEKGEALIRALPTLFREGRAGLAKQVEDRRSRIIREVEENIRTHEVPRQDLLGGVVKRNYESEIWKDEATRCVECGACTNICPTCHCFLIYDQKDERHLKRFRGWDSCMLKDYARVAGGGNPRPRLAMRLRNRFEKKFDFFPKICGVYACTGCGRCVSACPAKIDIREVLKRLVENE